MSKHFNTSITLWLQRIFSFKGIAPTDEVSEMIQPVVVVEPGVDIARSVNLTNGTAATIFTTPADKDFYLISATVAVIKDVTSTSTGTFVQVFMPDGTGNAILRIPGITLTPQSGQMSISYPVPIRLARNTVISVNNTTATANISAQACITGFTMETTAFGTS